MDRTKLHGMGMSGKTVLGAAVIAAIMAANGCISIKDRLVDMDIRPIKRTSEPTGKINVNLMVHPDNLGWTVKLTEAFKVKETIEKYEVWEETPFFFYPPAILTGIIACPRLLSGWEPVSYRTRRDAIVDNCMRMIGFETTRPIPDEVRDYYSGGAGSFVFEDERAHERFKHLTPTPAYTRLGEETKTIQERERMENRALRAGRVEAIWQLAKPIRVSYPVDLDGKAIVRLEHLLTKAESRWVTAKEMAEKTTTVRIEAFNGDTRVDDWAFDIDAEGVNRLIATRPAHLLDSDRPDDPRVGVDLFDGTDVWTAAKVRYRIMERLRKIGVSIVSMDSWRERIRKEQYNQHRLALDEKTVAKPGEIAGANIAVMGEFTIAGQTASLTAQVLDMTTGKVLWLSTIEGEKSDLTSLEDVIIGRLADAFQPWINRQSPTEHLAVRRVATVSGRQ